MELFHLFSILIVLAACFAYINHRLLKLPNSIRLISMSGYHRFIRLREKLWTKTLYILTWGGLRGGISIALALSIPIHLNKDI